MPRPKAERNSSDLEAEIALLEQERKRLIEAEDQRRGAILRDLLSGSAGNALRTILQPLVPGRDAFLFGLEASNGKKSDAAPARRSAPPSVESSSQLTIEAETSSNRAS